MRKLWRQFRVLLRRVRQWRWQWQWVLPSLVILSGITVWVIYKTEFLAGSWGIKNDEIAVITIEREKDTLSGKPESITVVAPNKSLWDASQLILVPLVLAALGFWFQYSQQKQAADENREEALQLYFDRISTLLIDKNLTAAVAPKNNSNDDQEEFLEAYSGVIKARTLSILRRFEEDSDRKGSVIRFLVELGIMHKLNIDLKNTNLSKISLSETHWYGAELEGVDLCGADLHDAELPYSNLNNAKLRGAKLRNAEFDQAFLNEADLRDADLFETQLPRAWLMNADLRGADLRGANLSGAKLSGANLSGAKLSGAILRDTDLHGADLRRVRYITEEQLKVARICKTQLPDGVDIKPNRDCPKSISDLVDRLGYTTQKERRSDESSPMA